MISSSLSISTHLWANLPLDLLISITKRVLLRSDLLSFRLVCSDWRSAVPCPKDLPWYSAWPISMKDGSLYFILQNNEIVHSIPLPFPSDGNNIKFLFATNGWLLFVNYNYYSYHLFDPVSKQYHMLPPLSRPKKMKRNDIINHDSVLHKVVVSRSRDGGVMVAGIVKIYDRTGCFTGCRFSFFEIGKEKGWLISKNICDDHVFTIIGGGDSKRFYGLDKYWGLYLLEAGPLMLWRRFNLYLPKHILNKFNSTKSTKKRSHIWCGGLTEVDDGYLEVRGVDVTRKSLDDTLLILKVKGSGLRICSRDANAYGDGNWTVFAESMYNIDHIFKPRLGSIELGSLKLSS